MIYFKKYISYFLLIVSIILLYLYLTKPTVDTKPYIDKIHELNIEADSIKDYYKHVLDTKDNKYTKIIEYKDSIIHAKLVNNYNLIIKHEKELQKYKTIDGDSIYNMWTKIVSSNKR